MTLSPVTSVKYQEDLKAKDPDYDAAVTAIGKASTDQARVQARNDEIDRRLRVIDLNFDAFVEAGGNFFDSADGYTNGTSEKTLGEFIKGQREKFVIATKYSFNARPGDPNAGGNHRKNMVQALEGSLKRLGADYVDVYWVHAWDELTPSEEVMRGLDDLVRQGKILYVGVSNTPAWVVSYSNAISELRGWSPFVGLHVEYNFT